MTTKEELMKINELNRDVQFHRKQIEVDQEKVDTLNNQLHKLLNEDIKKFIDIKNYIQRLDNRLDRELEFAKHKKYLFNKKLIPKINDLFDQIELNPSLLDTSLFDNIVGVIYQIIIYGNSDITTLIKIIKVLSKRF